jgi:hypothetical protein
VRSNCIVARIILSVRHGRGHRIVARHRVAEIGIGRPAARIAARPALAIDLVAVIERVVAHDVVAQVGALLLRVGATIRVASLEAGRVPERQIGLARKESAAAERQSEGENGEAVERKRDSSLPSFEPWRP